VSRSETTSLSDKDGIPYGEVYALLRRWTGEPPYSAAGEGGVREAPPLRWDRPVLVKLFQRLGTVPPRHSAKRAALRVLLAATEMAKENDATVEEVYATLLALCDPDGEEAVCTKRPRCGKCPINAHCRHASRRPSLKELPESERPRERLLAAGEAAVTDAELLAILIGGGSKEESALALAQRLLASFGSLHRLAAAGNRELSGMKGIGKAKVAQMRAGFEIGRRLAAEPIAHSLAVKGSEQVFAHFHERMKDLKRETFLCLMLDTKHNVIREEQIAVGSLSESVVHPREVFRPAIAESAAAVFFLHNHPSGNPQPSAQDRQLTRRLLEVGKLVGIRVLDHIIIGRDCYYSFAGQKELDA